MSLCDGVLAHCSSSIVYLFECVCANGKIEVEWIRIRMQVGIKYYVDHKPCIMILLYSCQLLKLKTEASISWKSEQESERNIVFCFLEARPNMKSQINTMVIESVPFDDFTTWRCRLNIKIKCQISFYAIWCAYLCCYQAFPFIIKSIYIRK